MAAARRENIQTYYPFHLSERQSIFTGLDEYEVLYGGAAGGGKTDAILAAALEFVHVPGYRAIVFRRTRENLADLIERTHEWWHGKAQWSGSRRRWLFPGGGRIYLGGMQLEKDKFKYKGPAFQFVGWDELTEFLKTQYLYMFSRLRKPKCREHKVADMNCQVCHRAALFAHVPLRVRAGTNPDGEGREWVKERFVSDEAASEICSGRYATMYRSRSGLAFVPSRVEDNPGLDAEEYREQSLSRLDPVTRERLGAGDWRIRPDGLIREDWIRRYAMSNQIIQALNADGTIAAVIDERQCRRFATIDTAGTSEEKAKEKKGKPPSWSVCQIWDYWSVPKWLILRHVWRKRVDWNGLKAGVKQTLEDWQPKKVLVENAHYGQPLVSELKWTTELIAPGVGKSNGKTAKENRSIVFQNMLEQGSIYLPQIGRVPNIGWLADLESEWFSWTGQEEETADQIDTASMAANHVGKQGGNSWGGAVSPRSRITNSW